MRANFSDRFFRSIVCVSFSALLLAGCGGGESDSDDDDYIGSGQTPSSGASNSSGSPAGTSAPKTFIYITDNFETQYDGVWITISKITAHNGTNETILIDNVNNPRSVNLINLKREGLLLGSSTVPTDTTQLRVYIGGQAKLVSLAGTISTVPVERSASGYVSLSVNGSSLGTQPLVVDFDLPEFRLVGGTLVPSTKIAGQSEYEAWTARSGEFKGTVTAIGQDTLTIDVGGGQLSTFRLSSFTTFRNDKASNWSPSVGSMVEVSFIAEGPVNQPTFKALSVHAEGLVDSAQAGDRPEVEGEITAINGNRITLSVEESEDITLVGSITLSIDGAIFTRGAASLLAVGRRIEAHVAQLGANEFRAVLIEIEGARKTSDIPSDVVNQDPGYYDDGEGEDDDRAGQGYAEIEGSFVSRDGNIVSLRIFKNERGGQIRIGDVVAFDLSNTVFREGSLGCLVSGSVLELKGYVNQNNQFVATSAEVDGPCNGRGVEDGSRPSGAVMEAKGRVISLGTNAFELEVYKVDDWYGAVPQTLSVRYNSNTFFEDISASAIRINTILEVKGSFSGNDFIAVKIERD